MYIEIIFNFFPVCDVITFKILKKLGQKFNYLQNEKSIKMKWKAFFSICKGI